MTATETRPETHPGGDGAVEAFARHRADSLAEKVRPRVLAADAADKFDVLASALTEEGYAANATPAAGGTQICQHHCPVAHVAAEFPQLCAAETQALAEVLGANVQRLATIAHGDGVCTTYIPGSSSQFAPAGGTI